MNANVTQLRHYQQQAINEIHVSLEKYDRVCLQMPTGGGKCLGKDTPVMLHDGTIIPVQSVKQGDLLMGDDGRPRTVLTTCQGIDELYQITPVKGDSWVCNSPHVLSLVWDGEDQSDRKNGQVYDIPLNQYQLLPISQKHCLKQFRVPVESLGGQGGKLLTGFKVESIGKGEYYGFELDGNGRFLLGDFTVTHNTNVFSHFIAQVRQERPYERVVALAHRKELIKQMHQRLGTYGVPSWQIYGGKLKNPTYPVQCGSVQTLRKTKEHEWPEDVGLIVIDESHHLTKDSGYDVVLKRYPKAKVLGVTATPCRLDGKGLDYAFEHLILGPTVQSLMDQGYLSQFRAFKGMCPDLSNNHTRAGDYQIGELADTMSDTLLLGDLVRAYKEKADGMSTIVFAVNIEHSQSIVRRYKEAGIEAEHLDGGTPELEREAILHRFKDGTTKILSNVGIVTEGFDVPACFCVQLARPTQSLSLYLQMVGRALRPHPGKVAIILDHGSNIDTHGLPTDGHEWSLQGVKKRTRVIEIDPETQEITVNEEETEKKEILEMKAAEMIEVGQSFQDRIKEICLTAEIRGYQKMWAYHRTLELFQRDLTLEHMKFLAKQLGYHWKWAVHKFEEWQQERSKQMEEQYGSDW